MTKRAVWYLAHPLKPDDHYTVEQNMDHVVKLTRLFFEHNVYVCTPYHTTMLALDDDNIEHRNMGIEADNEVLKLLNRIILVGHRISFGMNAEMELIIAQGGEVKNFVGLPDEMLGEELLGISSELMF